MAVLAEKQVLKPYIKKTTGYIKSLLSSQHVEMNNGITLQSTVDQINNNLTLLNSNLTQVYRTDSGGDWTVKKYAGGWCELYIRLMVPHSAATAKAVNFKMPAGINLKQSRMQVTPALNGWNVADFYHNNAEQANGNIAIDSIDVVFVPKTSQSLTYNFDVCISGFLST